MHCLFIPRFRSSDFLRQHTLFVSAGLFGFFYAAIFASTRLGDELPKDWEQEKIELVGVVASLPEITERGERFRFDVEKIVTLSAVVPKHISLNFYRQSSTDGPKKGLAQFHAGERWYLTARLKRPHTTYNPYGFDFEAWALAEDILATGAIHNKSGYLRRDGFVWRPGHLVERLRENIGNRIIEILEDKPYAGVVRALVVGDDSQIGLRQLKPELKLVLMLSVQTIKTCADAMATAI